MRCVGNSFFRIKELASNATRQIKAAVTRGRR